VIGPVFFNKSSNAGPYISYPYRKNGKRSFIDRIRSSIIQAPIKDTGGKQIDLAPWPDSVDADGVVRFCNNQRKEYERIKDDKVKPDIVVYCTGYRQEFSFFNKAVQPGRSYPCAVDADVRSVWKRDDPTVGFIGFLRPSLGAIPPLSEMQAQLWILNLMAPERIPRPLLPQDEPHYRLHHAKGSRIHYGIDHESYIYQLGLDMDSAMGITEVLWLGLSRWSSGYGWRLPIVWALGANYNTKFRMRGPWRWDGAEDVMETEFWEVIQRRRWFFGESFL
jgi:dimethylaniline monooxygenase (N-oxide forming)